MRLRWKFILTEIIGILIIFGIIIVCGNYTRPAFPNDVPSELKTLPIYSLVAYNSSGATVHVTFWGVIQSVGGYSYGANAFLMIQANESSRVAGTPGDTYAIWGSRIITSKDYAVEDAEPSFKAVIPISEESNHQNLTFAGEMDVYYPALVSASTYTTTSKSVSGNFLFCRFARGTGIEDTNPIP